MENQPPVRKKWSERQFDLFAEVAKELGTNASKDDFERILDRIRPVQEPAPRGRRSRRSGGNSP